MTKLGFATT